MPATNDMETRQMDCIDRKCDTKEEEGTELDKKGAATRMLVGFGTPKSGFKIVLREKSLKD